MRACVCFPLVIVSGKETDDQTGKRKEHNGGFDDENHESKKSRQCEDEKQNSSESEVRSMQRFLEEFSALPVEKMDRKELWDMLVQKAGEPGNEWLKGELIV